ncbi:MAG: hypothetical protein DRG78_17320 [Epsilonproteobacteria bacterium]|nr:MAG: hypothetical protein DRG78_17320 [Campylobacterota bacterium]
MIKYYGTPLTPLSIFNEALNGRNTLIPFPRPESLKLALKICSKIIIDNGAFTLWRKGGTIDWNDFYIWLEPIKKDIEFYFIPDVIDGTELENDKLIEDYKQRKENKGVPIWHINESFERLKRLMKDFNYIAIGSAGEFRDLGTPKWHKRMNEAMEVLCEPDGTPKVKIHMLRCLNYKIFTMYPFYSGDSTSLAQNHKRDTWQKIVNKVESFNSPKRYRELGGLFAS